MPSTPRRVGSASGSKPITPRPPAAVPLGRVGANNNTNKNTNPSAPPLGSPRSQSVSDPYFLVSVGNAVEGRSHTTMYKGAAKEPTVGVQRTGLYEAPLDAQFPKPPPQRPSSARGVAGFGGPSAPYGKSTTATSAGGMGAAGATGMSSQMGSGYHTNPIPSLASSRPPSASAAAVRPPYTPRPASARNGHTPPPTPIPVKGLVVDPYSDYVFGQRPPSAAPMNEAEKAEVRAAMEPRPPRPLYADKGSEAVHDAMRYTASPVPGGTVPLGVAPNDEEVIQQLDTLDDIIRFFSNKSVCRESAAKFVYMQRQLTPAGKPFDPYTLRVIPQPLLPCEHFVFSEPTVVHRFADDRPTEVTPLTTFARDVALFRAVGKIRFFANYLKHKAFVMWRRNIRYKRFLQQRREVGNTLFLAKHAFARNVNDLRKAAYPLEAVPLVKTPTIRDGISREEFVAALVQQRNTAYEVYRVTVEGIEKILALLCQRIAALADVPDFCSIDALYQYFQLTEEEAARKAGHRINAKAISMAQSKANNERRLAQLKCALADYTSLPSVVKLLDSVCVELLFRSALRSVAILSNEMLSDDEEKSVSFVVSVSMNEEGLSFVPCEKDMHSMISDLTEEIVSTVAFVPRVITNRSFKDYQYESRGLLRHFPIADTLRNDYRMRRDVNTLHHVIERDYAAITSATRHYHTNIEYFEFVNVTWPKLCAEWDDRIATENKFTDIIPSLEGALTTQEFTDLFAHVEEALVSVREMHSIRRGVLVVTCAAIVEFLTSKLKEAAAAVEQRLGNVIRSRTERLSLSMTSRIKLIQDRPTSLARFAEFAQHLNNVVAYARDQATSLMLIEELYQLAEGNTHLEVAGPYEAVIGGQTSESVLSRFETAIALAKDYREQHLAAMVDALREEVLNELDVVITVIDTLCNPMFDTYDTDANEALGLLENSDETIVASEMKLKGLCDWEVLFGVLPTDISAVTDARRRHREQTELWSTIRRWEQLRQDLFITPITEVDVQAFSKVVDELYTKTYNKLHPKYQNDATATLLENLKETKQTMPTLLHLGNKHLRREHWNAILASTGRPFDPSITLESLKQLRLFDVAYRELISEQSAMASGEAQLMATMTEIEEKWAVTEFKCKTLRNYTDKFILDDVADIVQQAEEHLLLIQGCLASRFVGAVRANVEMWESFLTTLTQTIDEWINVQRSWMYLEFIFSFDDIKHQMPKETQMFRNVDEDFREVITRAQQVKACIPMVCEAPVLTTLQEAAANLDEIQRHLETYLETKRSAFPRFYFLSNDELISLLSDVRNSRAVRPHLRKCFENIQDLTFKTDTEVTAMISAEGELTPLTSVVNAKGNVETWLAGLESAMVGSLKSHMQRTLVAYAGMRRMDWVLSTQNGVNEPTADTFPAQCILAVDMVQWTYETETAITSNSLRRYYSDYLVQIETAVDAVRQDLSPLRRSLLGILLVIDVHNRDVLETLIEDKVDSLHHFSWSAQMTYFADKLGGVTVKHVNASLPYSYEYLGSPTRLVITPLTDRAFLTCTQALHLNLGGAPQGPAGTGKTESVKDLGKALARQVVVFNCSDGMNTSMMSRMFAGLAQAGAWACFDEFNRIELEVLSVVAQQMLEITQGVAQGKMRMIFDGHDIRLHSNFGVFITMNPGYAGRTELPDNLKALFRPVCMMVPDYRLIAEIMFFSEGFRSANALSVKMTQLYKLSSEQLSKQDHYDFGMRAVKSVLVTAGALKRASPSEDEDMLLIKAMRDSNVPKFLEADAALFNAIIQDLYPRLVITESPNATLTHQIKAEVAANGLVETSSLLTKSIQLYDTMRTRHGVMMVGHTLTGKTTIMKLLEDALTHLEEEQQRGGANKVPNPFFTHTHQHRINPKAITGEELYGYVNVTTREWTDGVLGVIVRKVVAMANENTDRNWVVFDGPVDAVWIENMNTVLDDSKMLCLVNGERIKIPSTVSFAFEVEDLKVASPATVSRCGMVYVAEGSGTDVWMPVFTTHSHGYATAFADAWHADALAQCVEAVVKPFLATSFKGEAYVPTIVAQQARAMLQLLAGLVGSRDAEDDEPKEAAIPETMYDEDDQEVPTNVVRIEVEGGIERGLEPAADGDPKALFKAMCAFAFIWGFGGSLQDEDKLRFSTVARPLLLSIVPDFPSDGSVFDYTLHKKAMRWVPWAYRVPSFIYNPTTSFHNLIVPTPQAVATRSVMVTLLKQRQHVLLSGSSGTGKSIALQAAMFEDLSTEDTTSAWESMVMVFSARTTPHQVNELFESKLRRHPAKVKHMLCIGPAAGKTFVACIDDINIPMPEKYGASPSLELIRQIICEGGSFDTKKCVFKFVENVVFVATAGPTGGGRQPMPNRLTSRFFVVNQPHMDEASLGKITTVLLTGFFSQFAQTVQELVPTVSKVLLSVYSRTVATQLPMPDKSHYTFNSRDVGRVMQGLMQFEPITITTPKELADGLMHEMIRVFHDRLADEKDRLWWHAEAAQQVSEGFGLPRDEEWPMLIYGDFGPSQDGPIYQRVELTEELWDILGEKMQSYGLQYNRSLDLVMFEDAIAHLVRLCRILRQPRGSALLIGMSGCGRQSLANLASFICNSDRFQITTTRGYDVPEFRADIKRVLLEAGCNGQSCTLILSEDQLVRDTFLEDINNLLNTGEIVATWEPEEMERIVSAVRPVVTKLGLAETINVIKAQFVSRCRDNFHLVLTMSPVGEKFRHRIRMFPALVNCMTLDWYEVWPKTALLSVATRILQQMDAIAQDDQLVEACGEFTVYVHEVVERFSKRYRDTHRRHTYITPSTYLTYLETLATLHEEEQGTSTSQLERLRLGIAKIAETQHEVDRMQQHLTTMKPQLEKQTVETEEFAVNVSKEQQAASVVAAKVAEEEASCAVFMRDCKHIKDECQASLDKAMPEYHAALEALNSLNPKDINEARSYASPPKKVGVIMDAVLTVLEEAPGWDSARKVMGKPDFIQTLRNFKADAVPEKTLRKLKKFTEMDDFRPELVQSVSKACVSFCIWCRAIDKYGEVLKVVRPKEQQLQLAEAKLKVATEDLQAKQGELRKLEARIDNLKADYSASILKKERLEQEKIRTETHLSRASRILDGLGGEQTRWVEEVARLEAKQQYILGSTFINAALVTYGGPFPASYRSEMSQLWAAKARDLGFSIADRSQDATDLCEPIISQGWVANGLPHDAYSIQNGAILSKSNRWCLCIDPQGQANRWVKNMYRERGLVIMKPTDGNLLLNLETAVRRGIPTLIENLGETVDAALNPILTKQVFRHAGAMMIIIRDQPVEYNPNFMLFMTTRLPNPHYLPEVQIKATLVNFALTEEGLQDQFLGHVVRHEQRELEEKASALIIEVASQQAQLKEVQDNMLQLLSYSTGNLLDDERLIETLGKSKETSSVIGTSLAIAEQTSQDIASVREQYTSVAQRAATLYSIITDLSQLDHSYQFSLAAFTALLQRTMRHTATTNAADQQSATAASSSPIADRCAALIKQLMVDTYTAVCRGVFEKDKRVFAFLISSTIQRQQKVLGTSQWTYLMRGSQGVVVDGLTDPPAEWISEAMWEELQFLSKQVTGFPDVCAAIEGDLEAWKELYAHPFADETPPLYASLSTWQRILLMRTFKDEALSRLVRQYVIEVIGQTFAESPPFNLAASFESSSPLHPMILLLSAGTDPTAIFNDFAESRGFGQLVHMLSLGQGQGKQAEQLVREAARSGHWVYLQNCHVYQSWMPQLEALVSALSELSPHEDFRLWLTTTPSTDFPISVLQAGVKVTREPPEGLRANFRDTFASLTTPSVWEAVPEHKRATWHNMMFALSLFHASILERRRFGPLGWNIAYEWNAGDLNTTVQALKDFVTAYDNLPWAAIQYMIGNIHYGGRVTDQWDTRCLCARVSHYLSEQMMVAGHAFSADGSYSMPASYRTAADVLAHITATIPTDEAPEMFGLHDNAESAYQARLSRALLRSVIEVQPRDIANAKDGKQQVLDTIADLSARLPPLISTEEAHSSTYALGDNGTITALGAVVWHEVEKYNTLLTVIRSSLGDLKKSLAGTIVMDEGLEKLLGAVTYQLVPAQWEAVAYPSTRTLSSWFNDLIQRVEFFRDWNENGVPMSYWLGGFIFPQGFLTAVLQTHSRQHHEPIDQLSFDAVVTKDYSLYDSKLDYITDGVYVHGLGLEGARWDTDKGAICESLPRQLESKMPIMWLLPVRAQKSDAANAAAAEGARRRSSLVKADPLPKGTEMYMCPTYKINTRAGTLSTTGISTNFIVALKLPAGDYSSEHWVSRGTALIAAPVE